LEICHLLGGFLDIGRHHWMIRSIGDFGRSIGANMGGGGPDFGEEVLQGIYLSVRA